MKNVYLPLKVFFLTGLLLSTVSLKAQIGFNNPNPDTTALIDMKANDKGLLIPRMTTSDRDIMAGKRVAHALLVFDTDKNMFFVFDTTTTPGRWLALNPWRTEGTDTSDITITTSGNVGINTSSPTEKLEVNGNIKSNGTVNATSVNAATITSTGTVNATKFVGEGTVPAGAILMWSGSPLALPPGWALCDGHVEAGYRTPDLRGKFIVGYDPGDGDYNAVKKTGGEKVHTLTIAEMPSHSHSYQDLFQNDKTVGQNSSANGEQAASEVETSLSRTTGSAGGGLPHENRPPYYVLAYIIKLP